MSSIGDRRLLRLTALLDLEQRAREAATVEELGFLAVNETHALVPYRQAALWLGEGRSGHLAALSGLAIPDRNAPFAVWLRHLARMLATSPDAQRPRQVTAADLPAEASEGWAEWLPAHLLWLPLQCRGRCPGVLLLAREEPWAEAELRLLEMLAGAYAHALASLARSRRIVPVTAWRRRALALAALAAAAALGAVPVRDSVLAPAEVIPRGPEVIRAPLEGVVERIHVRPNEAVSVGQLLLSFDPTRLQNQLEVARKAAEVAELELRQATQAALGDARARASVPVLQARLDQQRAEAGYLRDLLARIEIRATRSGIAIFDDPNEWLGRPVNIGERIMQVADPGRVELEIRLPVADAIRLEPDAEVRFFLNIDPRAPVPALLDVVGYRAQPGPDGVPAFRLKARFAETAPLLRIGLRGTAKLYGEEVPLAWYVFRKPLAALRTWLGY